MSESSNVQDGDGVTALASMVITPAESSPGSWKLLIVTPVILNLRFEICDDQVSGGNITRNTSPSTDGLEPDPRNVLSLPIDDDGFCKHDLGIERANVGQ